VKTTVIESPAELDELLEPWSELARSARCRHFQQYDWIAACARTLGKLEGRKLKVAALWDASRLLAVLPLTIRRHNGVRVLEWIGVEATDYCDALVDPAIDSIAALAELWHALKRRGGFDVVRLGHVRADAKIHTLLNPMEPWIETREEAQYLPLKWSSGQQWLQDQSAKMRERVKYGLRRLGKLGFGFHVREPGEPLEPLLDTALAHKRAWLVARKEDSFLAEPAGAEFLHTCAAAMAKSGSLHLSTIRSEDHVAACHVGFQHDGVLYYYMPTYDAAWSKYGVGTLLRDSLIMWACDHGFREFDMLLGAHDYKSQYGTSTASLQTLAFAHGPLGHVALSTYRLLVARRKAGGNETTVES
jgi:CelD/BcsL family acetyltransferase involved in cellulose biosynthesis